MEIPLKKPHQKVINTVSLFLIHHASHFCQFYASIVKPVAVSRKGLCCSLFVFIEWKNA